MDAPNATWQTLPAGRELDALVAVRVMGWVNVIEPNPPNRTWSARTRRHWRAPDSYFARKLPHYSTDITAAWEVVERMRNTTPGDEQMWTFADCAGLGWTAMLDWNLTENDAPVILAHEAGGTLPEAICRAALAAKESDRA